MNNRELYGLIRFFVTGNGEDAPLGDICSILGKRETMDRLEDGLETL